MVFMSFAEIQRFLYHQVYNMQVYLYFNNNINNRLKQSSRGDKRYYFIICSLFMECNGCLMFSHFPYFVKQWSYYVYKPSYLVCKMCYHIQFSWYLIKLSCYLVQVQCYLVKLWCCYVKDRFYLVCLPYYYAKLSCYLACRYHLQFTWYVVLLQCYPVDEACGIMAKNVLLLTAMMLLNLVMLFISVVILITWRDFIFLINSVQSVNSYIIRLDITGNSV